MTTKNGTTSTILIAYLTFGGLGLSAGLLGVAWPFMQTQFGLALDAVNVLLLVQTITYTLASFLIGRIMARLGSGLSLLIGMVVAALCLVGISLSQAWVFVVAFGLISGFGSGIVDAGLNLYVTAHHSARVMNWLHACFGVGITVGPLIMTYCVLNWKWQYGYAITGVVLLLISVLLIATRNSWRNEGFQNAEQKPVQRARISQTLRLPEMWFSLITFLSYVGLEIGIGQWAYTLLTQSRGVAAEVAGPWVSIYWGVFTGGRILFGLISTRFEPTRLLRWCFLAILGGAVLFAWNPLPVVGFFGLILVGFAEAPIFAMLMTATPQRVGLEHAENGVSLQMTCVGLGGAVLPGLIGTIGKNFGQETMTLIFVALAVVEIICFELSARAQTQQSSAVLTRQQP